MSASAAEVDHVRELAEGVGFEPTMTLPRHSGFQDRRHRPLGEPSKAFHRTARTSAVGGGLGGTRRQSVLRWEIVMKVAAPHPPPQSSCRTVPRTPLMPGVSFSIPPSTNRSPLAQLEPAPLIKVRLECRSVQRPRSTTPP